MYHLPRLRRNHLGLSKGLQAPEAKVDKGPFFTLKLTALNWLNYCISKSALTSSQTSHNIAFKIKPNPFEGKWEHFSECSFFLFSSGGICSFPKDNVKYYIFTFPLKHNVIKEWFLSSLLASDFSRRSCIKQIGVPSNRVPMKVLLITWWRQEHFSISVNTLAGSPILLSLLCNSS